MIKKKMEKGRSIEDGEGHNNNTPLYFILVYLLDWRREKSNFEATFYSRYKRACAGKQMILYFAFILQ